MTLYLYWQLIIWKLLATCPGEPPEGGGGGGGGLAALEEQRGNGDKEPGGLQRCKSTLRNDMRCGRGKRDACGDAMCCTGHCWEHLLIFRVILHWQR